MCSDGRGIDARNHEEHDPEEGQPAEHVGQAVRHRRDPVSQCLPGQSLPYRAPRRARGPGRNWLRRRLELVVDPKLIRQKS